MLIPVPSTACMEAREAASARLDGELAELDAARLDAHLRGCADCAAFVRTAEATARLVRQAPLDTAIVGFRPAGRGRRRPAAWAAVAAVVAVAALPSFLLGRALGSHGPVSTAALGSFSVTPTTGLDPGLTAMLRHGGESGRIIPV
jgi:anti-sigma factor RsiW